MADQVITKQELIDAQKDAQTLEDAVNGEPGKLIKSRTGREFYSLASVPQINTMTREEVTAAVAPKANKADVDTALSNLSTTANKYYSTLAAANADIANIALNQSVTIGEEANGGLWEKKTAGATSLTKSPYDPVEQAKADISAKTNINLYRGIATHADQYNASAFDKTTLKADYAPTEIHYKGMNVDGGFVVPFNWELRNKVQVWVKVKSAALNAGTNMRFLVQAVKQDNTAFLSVFGNVPDGSTGWIKLAETALNEANRAVFKHVNIQPRVTGGAELIVEDFYVGEGIPTNPFVRVNEPKDVTIARNSERKSILPHWTKMPVLDGVSYNENGDITIQSGKYFTLTLSIQDAQILYYCGYLDQANTGDCRIYWTGYHKGLATTFVWPIFPCSTKGNEFSLNAAFDKVIDKVKIDINNYSNLSST